MGLHFLFNGAEHGEPARRYLPREPAKLERIVEGFGWSLDHQDIEVMYRTPVDLYLDEWVY